MGYFYSQSTDPHDAHTPQNDRKQENSTNGLHKGMLYILFYQETETTEYIYTSQVKTTAGKKIVNSLLILKNTCH